MENKKDRSSRYHKFLQTNQVFIEDNQVYLKKDILDVETFDEPAVQWFPIRIQSTL